MAKSAAKKAPNILVIFGDDAARPRWIATEPGVGLRFLAP